MQLPLVTEAQLHAWASILINHSFGGVHPDDLVVIKGERIAWPLIQAIETLVIQAGANSQVLITPPGNDRNRINGSSAMATFGTVGQIERVPRWITTLHEEMTHYIEIFGAEMPELYNGRQPELVQAIAKVNCPLVDIRCTKPWVLTLWPTEADALGDGLDFQTYVDIVVAASTVDPQSLMPSMQVIHKTMCRSQHVVIKTMDPRNQNTYLLTMEIGGTLPEICCGKHNWMDGEVYTSPLSRSVQGEIFLDMPLRDSGTTIRGIYLKIENGVIVEYSAIEGENHLRTVIETDDGSHRIGEIAFGTNPALDRVLSHPLPLEKMGGTIHIAIGQSYSARYPDPAMALANGDRHESAQHLDVVASARPGGCVQEVWLDSTRFVVDPATNLWMPAK